jgi:hypothetical protein
LAYAEYYSKTKGDNIGEDRDKYAEARRMAREKVNK